LERLIAAHVQLRPLIGADAFARSILRSPVEQIGVWDEIDRHRPFRCAPVQ
jgi:hypothetical protein